MITYKKGNLLEACESIIVHGCNAQHKMRSGVAKALREKWPEATWDRYDYVARHGGLHIGNIIIGETSDKSKIIVNAITQEFYGYDKKLYLSYDGLERVFRKINLYKFDIDQPDKKSIAIPRIGAGRAGGDWNIIENIIEKTMTERDVVVYDL